MSSNVMTTRSGRCAALGVLAVGIVLGTGWAARALEQQDGKDGKGQPKSGAARQADTLSQAFRSAAHDVLPSVVTVQTSTKPRARAGQPESRFRGSPFEELFKNNPQLKEFFDNMPDQGPMAGLGSGVIIDAKGIILTNNHVVADADEVKITLATGEVYTARDVKTDPKTDVAVLWIDPKTSLTPARLGDSDQIDVGDWVVAVGNPFGLELTVTAGIISAKGRGIGATFREDFLQTDAAINPGNSGGPLVNMNGEVIGINTAISTSNGMYQGAGFAIPVNMAKWVSDQLVDQGTVKRSYLGVAIQEMNAEMADQFGLRINEGVLVGDVGKGTPGQKAGIQPGDVILSFADKEVKSTRGLQRAVEVADIGSTQKVVVLRKGERKTLDVHMDEQPEKYGMSRRLGTREREKPDASSVPGLGLDVQDLTPELAKQLGHEGREGVVIRDIEAGGAAARAGLRPGMLIVEADRQELSSSEQFKKAVDQAIERDGRVLLRVVTSDGARYVSLKVK